MPTSGIPCDHGLTKMAEGVQRFRTATISVHAQQPGGILTCCCATCIFSVNIFEGNGTCGLIVASMHPGIHAETTARLAACPAFVSLMWLLSADFWVMSERCDTTRQLATTSCSSCISLSHACMNACLLPVESTACLLICEAGEEMQGASHSTPVLALLLPHFNVHTTTTTTTCAPCTTHLSTTARLDGYSFAYPEQWAAVTSSGNDIFLRNPFNVEQNLFVDISSPSSSR